MGNRMNRGPGSGKVLNGSEGVKGGRVLNVTVSSTTLQTDIRSGGQAGPEGVRGGGESNEQRPRIWKGSEWLRGGQRGWSLKCHRLMHYIADRYKARRS